VVTSEGQRGCNRTVLGGWRRGRWSRNFHSVVCMDFVVKSHTALKEEDLWLLQGGSGKRDVHSAHCIVPRVGYIFGWWLSLIPRTPAGYEFLPFCGWRNRASGLLPASSRASLCFWPVLVTMLTSAGSPGSSVSTLCGSLALGFQLSPLGARLWAVPPLNADGPLPSQPLSPVPCPGEGRCFREEVRRACGEGAGARQRSCGQSWGSGGRREMPRSEQDRTWRR
jgi:hypothetical protein